MLRIMTRHVALCMHLRPEDFDAADTEGSKMLLPQTAAVLCMPLHQATAHARRLLLLLGTHPEQLSRLSSGAPWCPGRRQSLWQCGVDRCRLEQCPGLLP